MKINRRWIDINCLEEKVMVDKDDMFLHAVAHRYMFTIEGWKRMDRDNAVTISYEAIPKLKLLIAEMEEIAKERPYPEWENIEEANEQED